MTQVWDRPQADRPRAQRAVEEFRSQVGRPPTAVWSAPGRVNLIGEHTDYNDGFVLPFALPHRTAVAGAPRTDGVLSVSSLVDDGHTSHADPMSLDRIGPGTVTGWPAYPAGVAWVLRQSGVDLPGADLVLAGDVPAGAGLSSSHSLECAVALTLLEMAGHLTGDATDEQRRHIAQWVQHAENDFVGAPTGLLDQTASLLCTSSHALFYDVRSGIAEQIPLPLDEAGLRILVTDTQANHAHSESGYGDRRRGCERAAELIGVPALRDVAADHLASTLTLLPEELRPLVRHVVTENARVLDAVGHLRSGDLATVGPLLTASHESLRDDYRISCPELDAAVESALSAGALGARMIGGGFGGSAIALINEADVEDVQEATRSTFAQRGFTEPRLFTAVPAAGARRES